MPRGGKREGAGRKKGAPGNQTARKRASTERAIKAAGDGAEPLEVLLVTMRHFYAKKQYAKAAQVAAIAAPYRHSRLSAIQHSGGLRLIHHVSELTDDELAAIAGEGEGETGA